YFSTLRCQGAHQSINVAKHRLDRSARLDGAGVQRLDQCQAHLPYRRHWRFTSDLRQLGKYTRHVAVAFLQLLATNNAEQCNLVHLANLARQRREIRVLCHRQRHGTLAGTAGQVGFEQGRFREQGFATRGTQVIQQWQQYQRQVTTTGLDTIQVGRQLQDGAHQGFLGVSDLGYLVVEQRLCELFHFLG